MLRSFILIVFLSGLATASLSHTFSNRGISLHPPPSLGRAEYSISPKHLPFGRRAHRRQAPASWSNAKRLAEGYPLKAPTRRYKDARGLTSPSPSPSPSSSYFPPPSPPNPTQSDIVSVPPSNGISSSVPLTSSDLPSSTLVSTPSSSTPVTPPTTPSQSASLYTRGYFGCTDVNSGTFFGYISRQTNTFGEYGRTNDPNERLIIEVDLDAAQEGPVDLTIVNGATIPTYPFFGAMAGFANTGKNLSPGSYNYAYLGGTAQTAPGAPAENGPNSFSASSGVPVDIQSAIWRYDASSQELTPSWVNADGSLPEVHILYNTGADAFILTADPTAFAASFGAQTECALSFGISTPSASAPSAPTTSIF